MQNNLSLKITTMKTQLLAFAVLLIGGLIFTSCQKDNALLDDNAFAKNEFLKGVDTISFDPIKNYPDPFLNTTTIEYRLKQNSHIRLSVSNIETGYTKLLYEGPRNAGAHIFKFKAYNLPNGEYTAELVIRDKVFTEVMTKKGFGIEQDVQDQDSEE